MVTQALKLVYQNIFYSDARAIFLGKILCCMENASFYLTDVSFVQNTFIYIVANLSVISDKSTQSTYAKWAI